MTTWRRYFFTLTGTYSEKNWCRRSESTRHGVEAPRDFETIQPKLCPSLKLNKSYHLQTLMSSLKLTESWLLLGFCDVIFLPWAQFRHSLRAIFYVGVSNRERHGRAQLQAQSRYKFGGIKNTTMGLFENSACVFSA